MKKYIILVLILLSVLAGNIFAVDFKKGRCSADLILHQNLNAPKPGHRYIKNGRYNRYTRGIVREAHILQKHLNRLGFNAGKVDGIIGPKTRAAILRLQRYLGTKADGYVGPKTRALLNNSCGEKNVSVDFEKYSGDLKKVRSEKELKDFLAKKKNHNEYFFGNDIVLPVNDGFLRTFDFSQKQVLDTAMETSLSLKSAGASLDYSGTNIQVDGVDEADITKTDGKYIYTISKRKKIYIFDAENPEEMKTVAKLMQRKMRI